MRHWLSRSGMRRGWALSVPLSLLLLLAGSPARAAVPLAGGHKAAMQKQIEEQEQHWQTALLANDTTTMSSLLEDGYVGIGPDGTIASKSEEMQARATGQDRLERLDVLDRKIRIYGTTAVVTSKVRIQGIYSGAPLLGEYRYTRVWTLQHGQWLVVSFEANRVHDTSARRR